MSIGTEGDVLSAIIAGESIDRFYADDAGGDAPAADPAPANGPAEASGGDPAPAAASAAPSAAAAADEPPAWFKAWLSSQQPKPAPAAQPEPQAATQQAEAPEFDMDLFLANPAEAVRKLQETAFEAERQRMQAEIRQITEFRSHQAVLAQPDGAAKLQTAVDALKAAAAAGQIDGQKARAFLEQHNDPFGEIIRWHAEQQRQAALAEIGDPAAYRERIRAELLAEMQGGGGEPAAQSTNVTPMPTKDRPRGDDGRFTHIPSLNRQANAGAEIEGPVSGRDKLKAALNGR